jgi:serine/threonine-protein kinase RsbW
LISSGLVEMVMSETHNLLVLDSRLAELGRAQSWIDACVDRLGLSESTHYAVHLCLEESLANIVLHGYKSEPGHPIVLRCRTSSEWLFFIIEDTAPPFAPIETAPPRGTSEAVDLKSLTPSGNGIRLLRQFAGSLAYERLSEGNRLTIGFSIH